MAEPFDSAPFSLDDESVLLAGLRVRVKRHVQLVMDKRYDKEVLYVAEALGGVVPE